MATTYARIRQILYHLQSYPDERQLSAVARNIRLRRLSEFRLRGSGSALDEIMSEASISRLIGLMAELGLVRLENGELRFRVSDFAYVRDDDSYAKKIDQKTKNLLKEKGAPLTDIGGSIENTRLPSAPDARTLYKSLHHNSTLPEETFARLLYLLASAGKSVTRSVHVHYQIG